MNKQRSTKRKIGTAVTAVALSAAMAGGILPTGLGVVASAQTTEGTTYGLSNPTENSQGRTEWSTITFGAYPQTEIVGEASQSGAYARNWGNDSDYYEVDTNLYAALANLPDSKWNANGDTVYNGVKYRRVLSSDATYDWGEDTELTCSYNWSASNTYHYFRYDPIKWRVLQVDGDEVYLLADRVLDTQKYNLESGDVTWESSTIRSWLNGYGAESNSCNQDYTNDNFMDTAFSDEEQEAIDTSYVVNSDSVTYGADGGNDTEDQIFLLADYELSQEYGFGMEYSYGARLGKASVYAAAMGSLVETEDDNEWSYSQGATSWALRTPGESNRDVAIVSSGGYTGKDNFAEAPVAEYWGTGIRPAFRINLAETDQWSYSGTVTAGSDYGTGLYDVNGQGVYYLNGVRQYTTGIVKVYSDRNYWFNLVNGVRKEGVTVAKNANGWWYIDEAGRVDFTYTGLAKNANGWWYCKNGKVDFSANTVAKNAYGWWVVQKGKVNFSATGIYKNANGWWYCKNGKVDFSANTVAKNANGWWVIRNGKVDFSFTGIAKNSNGRWYCKGGKVQFGYTGKVTYQGKSYRIVNGKVR